MPQTACKDSCNPASRGTVTKSVKKHKAWSPKSQDTTPDIYHCSSFLSVTNLTQEDGNQSFVLCAKCLAGTRTGLTSSCLYLISEILICHLISEIQGLRMCLSEHSLICDSSNCVIFHSEAISTISGGVDVNYSCLNTKHNEMLWFHFQTVLAWTLNRIPFIKKIHFHTVILRDLHVLIITFN